MKLAHYITLSLPSSCHSFSVGLAVWLDQTLLLLTHCSTFSFNMARFDSNQRSIFLRNIHKWKENYGKESCTLREFEPSRGCTASELILTHLTWSQPDVFLQRAPVTYLQLSCTSITSRCENFAKLRWR